MLLSHGQLELSRVHVRLSLAQIPRTPMTTSVVTRTRALVLLTTSVVTRTREVVLWTTSVVRGTYAGVGAGRAHLPVRLSTTALHLGGRADVEGSVQTSPYRGAT